MQRRFPSARLALTMRAGAIFWALWWVLGPLAAGAEGSPSSVTRVRIAVSEDNAVGTGAGLTPRGGRIELTLDDAIALALARNLSLLIQRYQHSQTVLGLPEALGLFDLDLDVNVGFNEDSSRIESALQDTEGSRLVQENLNADVSLSQLFSSGGRAGLNFNNSRSSSSDRNALFNPGYFTNLGISFNQPLLRGFGRERTRQSIILARNSNATSREGFQLEVEALVQQTADAYWSLTEALDQLRVIEESLELARALHDMNILREEAGVLAPLEVTRSEADVATREEEIIGRQADVENRTDELRGLLSLERGALWGAAIVPVTDPEFEPLEIDVDEAVETALADRPELRRLRIELENREIGARSAKDRTKPQLDLQARWGANAREGTTRVFADEDDDVGMLVENDYFDALDTLLNRDFEGWSLSLQLSLPVQNRQAQAQTARADLAVERGRLELKELEQRILIEVRNAVRAVETAARQIELARRSSELAKKTLEVEELSYRSGQSSGFEIMESQERLRAARSREVGAITNYRRAVTAFYRSIGKLLEENRIELAED